MRMQLTADKKAIVEKLMGEGLSLREIARTLNVAHSTVLRANRRWFATGAPPIGPEAQLLADFLIEQVTGGTGCRPVGRVRRQAIERFAVKLVIWHEEAKGSKS